MTDHINFVVELHGDQLYSWFKEKFGGKRDALTQAECHDFVRYVIRDAMNATTPAQEKCNHGSMGGPLASHEIARQIGGECPAPAVLSEAEREAMDSYADGNRAPWVERILSAWAYRRLLTEKHEGK